MKSFVFLYGLVMICSFTSGRKSNFPNNTNQFRDSNAKALFDLLDTSYDFIVIGGGSSGAVIANRLSEVPEWQILLIESGEEPNPLSEIPLFAQMAQTANNWNYTMEEDQNSCLGMINGRCPALSGRALGGSSAIDHMIYSRGHPADFDRWQAMVGSGWSYEDVFPYFMKSEDCNLGEQCFTEYHKQGGYQSVSHSYHSKLGNAFIEAGLEMGHNLVDYNSPQSLGVSRIYSRLKRGRRQSTSSAFLNPIRFRRNLFVLDDATVSRILISSQTKTAYGVQLHKRIHRFTVRVKKEIILSAGTLNSPKLLMLSGIGPREDLKRIKIPVARNLPVGRTLYDHITFPGLNYLINETVEPRQTILDPREGADFLFNGNGFFTSLGGLEGIAFIRTSALNQPIATEVSSSVETGEGGAGGVGGASNGGSVGSNTTPNLEVSATRESAMGELSTIDSTTETTTEMTGGDVTTEYSKETTGDVTVEMSTVTSAEETITEVADDAATSESTGGTTTKIMGGETTQESTEIISTEVMARETTGTPTQDSLVPGEVEDRTTTAGTEDVNTTITPLYINASTQSTTELDNEADRGETTARVEGASGLETTEIEINEETTEEIITQAITRESLEKETIPATRSKSKDCMKFTKRQEEIIRNPKQNEDLEYPDVQLTFSGTGSYQSDLGFFWAPAMRLNPNVYEQFFKPLQRDSAWSIFPTLLHPKSAGYLKLRSRNHKDPPLIHGSYFSDFTNEDIDTMLIAIRHIQDLAQTKSLQRYNSTLHERQLQDCRKFIFDSDDYWKCALRVLSVGMYLDQTGTCRMGFKNDRISVVDNRFKVHGIGNLRVADKSVIPVTMSGQTTATAIMIGERAADMIKQLWLGRN